jgi:hypothetical protein
MQCSHNNASHLVGILLTHFWPIKLDERSQESVRYIFCLCFLLFFYFILELIRNLGIFDFRYIT